MEEKDEKEGRVRLVVRDVSERGRWKCSVYHRSKQSADQAANMMDPSSSSNLRPMSSVAQKMMERMGYKEGGGLGKHQQGMASALETSKQKGRRGLGFTLSDVTIDDAYKWSMEKEEPFVSIEEQVSWIESDKPPLIDSELKDKNVQGPAKLSIEDETNFADPEIVATICRCKSVFDALSGHELRRAVSLSNPFETIEKGIFQNRAAMKMANIDHAFDYMFTNPKHMDESPMVRENSQDLLYFADICAGPGGFTEYVLWKKKWTARGFGFTLRGPNDFKLEEFYAASTETFEPHYGVDPRDGDGNIYDPHNLIAFRNHVLEHTKKCSNHPVSEPCTTDCSSGVHFVMADGGFSVEGQENLQEILSKRLYLCQFLTALGILRVGGHFVCKLFDIFTPFSVGLIYLMYRAFEKVCIFKPNTSRPANSERYLVCKWKRSGTDAIGEYMFILNCILDHNAKEKEPNDIIHVISLDDIKSDTKFFDYIVSSNNTIGQRQIVFLSKVKAFAEDETLIEFKQAELKNACLRLWNVPIGTRVQPPRLSPVDMYLSLMSSKSKEPVRRSYNCAPKLLTKVNLKSLEFHHSFKCMVLSGDDPLRDQSTNKIPTRGFIIGLGKFNNYIWDGQGPSLNFRKLDAKINLPPETLIYAESVHEMMGVGKGQRKYLAIHIIDSLWLGGIDVRKLPYVDRIKMTRKLVKACTKTLVSDLCTLRVKSVYELTSIERIFKTQISLRQMKSGVEKTKLCFDLDESKFIEAIGLLIYPVIDTDKYFKCWSKSKGKYYFFSKEEKKSVDFGTVPDDAVATFDTSFDQRLFWKWFPNGDNTKADRGFDAIQQTDALLTNMTPETKHSDVLDRVTFRTFIGKLK